MPSIVTPKSSDEPEPGPHALAFALSASELKFRTLAEVSLQAVFVHVRFRPVFVNRAFATLFGFPSAEVAAGHTKMIDLFDEETRRDPEAAWRRLAAGPATLTRKALKRLDGAPVTVELFAKPVLWEDRLAVAMALIDVGREERALAAVQEAEHRRKELEEADDLLVRRLCDDLWAPLGAAVSALEKGDLDSARAAVLRAQDRLSDGADRAAIARDGLTVNRAPTNLRIIAQRARSMARRTLGPQVAFDVKEPADAWIHADEGKLARMLAGLIEAATVMGPDDVAEAILEAGPTGVTLVARRNAATAPNAIRPNLSETLLLPSALMRAMNGYLVVHESGPGGWSAAAYAPTPRREAPAPPRPGAALAVLVVDDSAENRALLDLIVSALGHRVTLAASGAEALALAQAKRFDAVLMDLNMPGIDGYETARRLRRLETWPKSPIIALTANVAPGVPEAAAEAGMDAFIAKPVEIQRLASTLAMLAARDLVDSAELDGVQNEEHRHEAENDEQRGHTTLLQRNGVELADPELWR